MHGRILLPHANRQTGAQPQLSEVRRLLHSLDSTPQMQSYPFFRREMFSMGSGERPHYYDNAVVAFAATYKNLEDSWARWLARWEWILARMEFETAQVQLDTEFLGTYHFFWQSRRSPLAEKMEQQTAEEALTACPLWYFGMGARTRWGSLVRPLEERDIFNLYDFVYEPARPIV